MSEAQFIGYLVIALASLVGLFMVVGKPIMNAVKIMTELNASIETLKNDMASVNENMNKQVEHAKEGRKKLWEAHDALEGKIIDHDKRISNLETTVNIHHGDGMR